MKENRLTSVIVILGIIILCIFSYVIAINLIDNNNSSDLYYSKIKEEINGKINNIDFTDSKLNIQTSGDVDYICIKTTKSIPNKNSVCWNNIENNFIEMPIYEYKVYYIWLKSSNGKISDYYIYKLNK